MVKNLNEMVEYPEQGILSKELIKTDKQEATLFCMAKGTAMSEHTSTREAIVYVLEEKGTFTLEEEEIPMIPGAYILMKKNAIHSLRSEENTTFVLSLCN